MERTHDVDMSWPLPLNMGYLSLSTSMQAWVILLTEFRARGVKVMERVR